MEATFTAARKGEHHVVINFQSSELTDIYGQFTITEPPTFLDNMMLQDISERLKKLKNAMQKSAAFI